MTGVQTCALPIHLMLVDLQSKGITGKEAEKLLDSVNITCNKNAIPNDPASPFVTSGIRLGTAAVTTRGLNIGDMKQVAKAIAITIEKKEATEEAKEIVEAITMKYPMYE